MKKRKVKGRPRTLAGNKSRNHARLSRRAFSADAFFVYRLLGLRPGFALGYLDVAPSALKSQALSELTACGRPFHLSPVTRFYDLLAPSSFRRACARRSELHQRLHRYIAKMFPAIEVG